MIASAVSHNPNFPTFLLTDIEDSSRLVAALGHRVYQEQMLAPLVSLFTEEIARHHGVGEPTGGDGYFARFATAEHAVACVIALQKSLHDTPIQATDRDGNRRRLSVRMALHTAQTEARGDAPLGYSSHPDVNFTARILSQAGGAQILVSETAYAAVQQLRPDKWEVWPDRWLTSFEAEPQTLYELCWDGGPSRGEPGLRWLPATFRVESSLYVPRPELESLVRKHFATKRNNGELLRLVTLWGYGGMGKTRLAVACALKSVGAFRDGVYFVSLADRPVSGQAVVEAIGEALGIERAVGVADLLPALREAFVLLLLDNYESVHCDEAQSVVRELLRETRHLRLLVTSRESVHLPPAEKEVVVEGLTDEEAVRLFVERSRLQRRREGWTPTTAKEQAALKRLLVLTARIPLALELLAAWMGSREIGEIASELEKTPLPGLPKGYAHLDQSDRHQSLEKCLEYSYRLLGDAAVQRGLAALSLFGDSWDAETAAAACGIEHAQAVLDRLEETALLNRSADGEEHSRYAMLRPTRAYAAARLRDLSDAASIRTGYVVYYRQLVVDNYGINDLGKLAMLEREWRNVLSAADVADVAEDARSLDYLSVYLGEFLLLRGRWSERERLDRLTLEAVRKVGDRPAEGRSLNNLGIVYQAQGKWSEALTCYE
jgi:class 3 adenylate cyclase/predicted ATPase